LEYKATESEAGNCKVEILTKSGADGGAYPALLNDDGSGIAFIGLSTDTRSAAGMRASRVLRVVALDANGEEVATILEKATPNFGYNMALWTIERKDGMLNCYVGRDTKNILSVPDMGGAPGVYLRNLAGFYYAVITA
jgi:hypothetical protein